MSSFVNGQSSVFSDIQEAPPNPVLGLAQECNKDTFPQKINLTIGAYRDDSGRPYVLPSVKEAESILIGQSLDHEYLPQDGLADFNKAAQILLFGENSQLISSKCVHTIQGISGTGSLRLAMDFISKFMSDRICYIPHVSWENHKTMMLAANLKIAEYRYLDATGCSLDFNSFITDLSDCPRGSIILLHMCAHNPSGVDPSEDQWRKILEVVQTNDLFPFFDNAYQGFVTGCPDTDAFPVRLFAAAGREMFVACSFAKNFGLYGERAGALHVVTSSAPTVAAIASQLRVISRAIYSTCPVYGARIVSLILNTPQLHMKWRQDCMMMATRLSSVRSQLYDAIVAQGTPGDWFHLKGQRGMFSYTGIPAHIVRRLKEKHHIYMLENGRISLAGLNTSNITRFATCLLAAMSDE
eukprot:gene1104-2148_t